MILINANKNNDNKCDYNDYNSDFHNTDNNAGDEKINTLLDNIMVANLITKIRGWLISSLTTDIVNIKKR